MGLIGAAIGSEGGSALGGILGKKLGGRGGESSGRNIGRVAGSVGGGLFGFKNGGKVKKTGLALIHKNEYVLPANAKPTKAQKAVVAKNKRK